MSSALAPNSPRHVRLRRVLSGATAAIIAASTMLVASPAVAAPVYEIDARWAENTPAVVASGDVVNAEWRVNVNDDAAAPSNAPVNNVTFTAEMANGTFASLPDVCARDGVDPASSISDDGSTLVCNLGTQLQGSAHVVMSPVRVEGATGDRLSGSASINGAVADLTPLDLENAFGMDIRWDVPTTGYVVGSDHFDVDFQWTLNLARGSDAGPDSVTYDISLAPQGGVPTAIAPAACAPFTDGGAAGHPWSGGTHPPAQSTSFVDSCTLTETGTNTYRLTLSGIDYEGPAPTADSTGQTLPLDRTAVASGSVHFRIFTTAQGSVTLTSSAPVYTSPNGSQAQDDPANNTSSKTYTPAGGWASTWFRPMGGNPWDDTYRVAPGSAVTNYVHVSWGLDPIPSSTPVGQCTVIDTRHSTFAGTEHVEMFGRTPIQGDTLEYFVGYHATLDPDSPLYDPNAFDCGTGGADLGGQGWVTEIPDDLSTVSAVRVHYPFSSIEGVRDVLFDVTQYIKPSTPAGTDVWTWHSYRLGGEWNNLLRNVDGFGSITPTPDARYPYTTGARDILRVVTATPFVAKSADRAAVRPGVPATFTIGYAANGAGQIPETVDGFRLVDTLPLGMSYVAESADPEPTLTSDAQGRQVLTWILDGVPTNVYNALTYQAEADETVEPGQVLTNAVVANYGGQDWSATASVTVSTSGHTTIGKSADTPFIPNLAGDGVGEGSWTVTLRSFDPLPQSYTDTIDILPFIGDERGTAFSGDYELTGVDAVDGATVYYTTADPSELSDDPEDASNGGANTIDGNTVGWSTEFTPEATAVRVIGPVLAPGATQQFTVRIATDGVEGGDTLVNRAQARDGHTELVMRTSAPMTVANYYSAALKKYVQDSEGNWRDANTVEDYPSFLVGDTVRYRVVVENTGQGTLTDITLTDDQQPELGSFVIDELAPGEEASHEYEFVVDGSTPESLVNTACAAADIPGDSGVAPTINCDPAGIEIEGEPTHTKSIVAAEPIGGGQWRIDYALEVTNTSTASTSYSLADELHYTDQVDIVSAEITDQPEGVTLAEPAWDGQENLGVATSVPLLGSDDEGYAPHVYLLSVVADVPLQFASTDGLPATACAADGEDTDTAFNNTSELTLPNGDIEPDQACVPPPSIDIAKSVSAGPTPNGDGTWTVTYDVVATNDGGADGVYDLSDRMTADGDLEVRSGAVTDAPDDVTPLATWTGMGAEGAAENVIATEVALAAGASHTYEVEVVIGLAEGTEGAPVITECSAEPGEGGGLSNTAEIEHNDLTDAAAACITVGLVTVDKSVSTGSTPNGDGTWTVVYDIVATQVGAADAEYDVTDRLHFGEGIEIVEHEVRSLDGVDVNADWTGLGADDTDPANVVASGVTLEVGGTDTYQVEVTVEMDESTIDPAALTCAPAGSGEPGGLGNSTTLTSNGITAQDDVCPTLPLIELDKQVVEGSPVSNGDGTWTISYDVSATNIGEAAGDYDLSDRLRYGAGLDVESSSIVDGPEGVEANADWTGEGAEGAAENAIVAGESLEAGETHTFRIEVVAAMDRAVATAESLACPAPGSGEPGGFANTAGLTHNGEPQSAEACGEPPLIEIDKSVSAGPTANGDGTWTVTYDLVASNDSGVEGSYDLADRMTADGDLEVVSGAIADAPEGVTVSEDWTGVGAEGAAENVIATDIALAAGASHTYVVEVVIGIAEGVEGVPGITECSAEPSEDGGLSNTAELAHDGTTDDASACVTVGLVTVDKSVSDGPTANGDGTWTVVYDIVATHVGAADAVYDVTDRLHFGEGIEIVEHEVRSLDGIDVNADWTGLGAEDADAANLIAADVTLEVGGTDTYQVEVTVEMDESTIGPAVLTCAAAGSGEAGGLGNSTTLTSNGITTGDSVCPTLPLIELDKELVEGSPVANGDGTWTIRYDVSATNIGEAAGDYDLSDRLRYGAGLDIESSRIVDAPEGVEANAAWTGEGAEGAAENAIVEGESLEAGETHTFRVEVVAAMDRAVATPASLTCPAPGSGEPGGFANTADLVHNGEQQTDEACAEPPMIDITKSLAGAVLPVEGEEGVYDATYELTVTNSGPGAGVYDLDDELAPGEGVSVVGIEDVTTDAADAVARNEGFDGLEDVRIVTGQPIEGAATEPVVHTYTVTVRYATELAAVTLPAGDACTDDSGEALPGSLGNTATVGWNGFEGDDSECLRPGKPTLDKQLVTATPIGDGRWEVVYDLTVGNVGGEATTYDLDDELLFAQQISAESVAVDGPEGIELNAGFDGDADQRIATDVAIAGLGDEGYEPHVYRVTVIAEVPLHFEADAVGEDGSASPACTAPAGGNFVEQGFNNAATLTDEAGGTIVDTDCAPVPSMAIVKAMDGEPAQGDDGEWTVAYAITVTNDGAASGLYSVTDELRYGTGIEVTSATVTEAPEGVTTATSWTGLGETGSAENVVVTDVALEAGATHTYRVVVEAVLDTEAADATAITCPAEGSGDRGGFANTAGLTHNDLAAGASVCAVPEWPEEVPPPSLPQTGAMVSMGVLGGGVLLLLAGGMLLLMRRRAAAAAE